MPLPARPRVFVARRIPAAGLDPILATCDATVWAGDLPPAREELLAAVAGCDGILTLLTDRVDEALLDAAGAQLKVVSKFAVGFDNVDVRACTARGIRVGNTPGVLGGDRRPHLRPAARRRAPPARGDGQRARGPLADMGSAAAAGCRGPRRHDRDRRPWADRPGRRAAGVGVRDAGA